MVLLMTLLFKSENLVKMTGLNDTMRNAGKIEIIHDVIAGHNDVIGF